jgi:hypothetical protein
MRLDGFGSAQSLAVGGRCTTATKKRNLGVHPNSEQMPQEADVRFECVVIIFSPLICTCSSSP